MEEFDPQYKISTVYCRTYCHADWKDCCATSQLAGWAHIIAYMYSYVTDMKKQ